MLLSVDKSLKLAKAFVNLGHSGIRTLVRMVITVTKCPPVIINLGKSEPQHSKLRPELTELTI